MVLARMCIFGLVRLLEQARQILDRMEEAPWSTAWAMFIGAVVARHFLEMMLEVPHTLRFPLWDNLVQYPAYYLLVDLGLTGLLRAAGYSHDWKRILKVFLQIHWIVVMVPLLDALVWGPSVPAYLATPQEMLELSPRVFLFWIHDPPITAGMKCLILTALAGIWLWGILRLISPWKILAVLYGTFLWMTLSGSPPVFLYPPAIPWIFQRGEGVITAFFLTALGVIGVSTYGGWTAWRRWLRRWSVWGVLAGFAVGAVELQLMYWQFLIALGWMILAWGTLEEIRERTVMHWGWILVVLSVASFYKAVPFVLTVSVGLLTVLQHWPQHRVERGLRFYLGFLSGLVLWRGEYLFLDDPRILIVPLLLALTAALLPRIRLHTGFILLPLLGHLGTLRAPLAAAHQAFTQPPFTWGAPPVWETLRQLPGFPRVGDPYLRTRLVDLALGSCRFSIARALVQHAPGEWPGQLPLFLSFWGQDTTLPPASPPLIPDRRALSIPVMEWFYRWSFSDPAEAFRWTDRLARLRALSGPNALLPLRAWLYLQLHPEQHTLLLQDTLAARLRWVQGYAYAMEGDTLRAQQLLRSSIEALLPGDPYLPFALRLYTSVGGDATPYVQQLASACPPHLFVFLQDASLPCPCHPLYRTPEATHAPSPP